MVKKKNVFTTDLPSSFYTLFLFNGARLIWTDGFYGEIKLRSRTITLSKMCFHSLCACYVACRHAWWKKCSRFFFFFYFTNFLTPRCIQFLRKIVHACSVCYIFFLHRAKSNSSYPKFNLFFLHYIELPQFHESTYSSRKITRFCLFRIIFGEEFSRSLFWNSQK